MLSGPVQLRDSFSLKTLSLMPFRRPTHSGCRALHSYSFAGAIFRTAAECVRNGGVTPLKLVYDEVVVFHVRLHSALLAVANEVAIRELVTFEVIAGSIVRVRSKIIRGVRGRRTV